MKELHWRDPKTKPAIAQQAVEDWCHLCGRRSAPQVFVRSCDNAEHPSYRDDQHMRKDDPVLRACEGCLEQMLRVLRGQEKDQLFEVIHIDGEVGHQKDRSHGAPIASAQTPSIGEMVYVVQSGDDGPIKIGFSNDIKRRLLQLQGSHPYRLRLLASFVGGEALERRLHEKFKFHRMQGEWFESGPVLAWVNETLC